MKGPPRTSDWSPLLEIVLAKEDSAASPVPARYRRYMLVSVTKPAKNRAPTALENSGQVTINKGADKMCVILRPVQESYLSCSYPHVMHRFIATARALVFVLLHVSFFNIDY